MTDVLICLGTIIVLILLSFLFIFIWSYKVDKKQEEIDKHIEELECLIRHLNDEQKLPKPSGQMIAESGCDGDCKKCAGKNLCWQNRLNGDNKI